MGRGTALAILAAVAAALGLPAAAAAAPHDPFRRSIGTYLDRVEAGVCPVAPPARTRTCTVAQADRRVESAIGYGRYPHVPGHIVAFRLAVGTGSAGTVAAKVRFRALHGALGAGGRRAAGSRCRCATLACGNSASTCRSPPATGSPSTSRCAATA